MELHSKSIIICSIVRNAERGLRKNIPVITQFCSYFQDYHIVVYENNSMDQTKKILESWEKELGEKAYFVMEDTNSEKTIPLAKNVSCNPFFSKKRIAKMVSLRNQYMDAIDLKGWNADFLMIVDLDVAQLYLDPILTSFSRNIEWDAITAFGYSISPKLKKRYHDTYALTEFGDENNPQTEEKIMSLADKYGSLDSSNDWIRVFSAFGGLAIYKFEAVKGLRYQLIDNDDSRVEVRCEHYSIYKQMVERGYNITYINPAMILKYQSVSFNIIIGKIRRMFNI